VQTRTPFVNVIVLRQHQQTWRGKTNVISTEAAAKSIGETEGQKTRNWHSSSAAAACVCLLAVSGRVGALLMHPARQVDSLAMRVQPPCQISDPTEVRNSGNRAKTQQQDERNPVCVLQRAACSVKPNHDNDDQQKAVGSLLAVVLNQVSFPPNCKNKKTARFQTTKQGFGKNNKTRNRPERVAAALCARVHNPPTHVVPLSVPKQNKPKNKSAIT
jgi:hypothetical protein